MTHTYLALHIKLCPFLSLPTPVKPLPGAEPTDIGWTPTKAKPYLFCCLPLSPPPISPGRCRLLAGLVSSGSRPDQRTGAATSPTRTPIPVTWLPRHASFLAQRQKEHTPTHANSIPLSYWLDCRRGPAPKEQEQISRAGLVEP